jgi:hypothetical protein
LDVVAAKLAAISVSAQGKVFPVVAVHILSEGRVHKVVMLPSAVETACALQMAAVFRYLAVLLTTDPVDLQYR